MDKCETQQQTHTKLRCEGARCLFSLRLKGTMKGQKKHNNVAPDSFFIAIITNISANNYHIFTPRFGIRISFNYNYFVVIIL